MTLQEWLEAAQADARRRGLAPLVPILATLAASTTALRGADWNQTADDPLPDTEGDRR